MIKGKITPIRDNVLVSDMDFDARTTKNGIFLLNDDGKDTGIRPRWGQVWAVGQEQKDFKVGDWVLVEHGRWTRSIKVSQENTADINIHMVDANAIMIIADEKPNDILRSAT